MKKEHYQYSPVKCYDNYSYYLDVTNPLITPMIFIFLSCRENARDNKEFCRENSQPRRQSRIKTLHEVEPW